MIHLIEANRPALERLCAAYRVARLEVFGSAAAGDFNPQSSDLDFLVEFHRSADISAADQYFGLLEGLQDLFRRNIDLVEAGAMRNPYFIKRVNESRRAVYAA